MKKVLLILCIISVHITSLSISVEMCQDVLDEIKKNAPYAGIDAATFHAAKIASKASQVQNNVFSSKEDKQNAARQAECAEFFSLAGVYYTAQMNFEKFHAQFSQEQKSKSTITQQEFLKAYLDKQADKNMLDKLMLQTRDRMKNPIATRGEKAQGLFWNRVLEEYKKAHLPKSEKENEKKEEEQASIEEYIK